MKKVLHYLLLGVINFNGLRGCDPIYTQNDPAQQTHKEYRVNMGKLAHRVRSVSYITNMSINNKGTYKVLPELITA